MNFSVRTQSGKFVELTDAESNQHIFKVLSTIISEFKLNFSTLK